MEIILYDVVLPKLLLCFFLNLKIFIIILFFNFFQEIETIRSCVYTAQ